MLTLGSKRLLRDSMLERFWFRVPTFSSGASFGATPIGVRLVSGGCLTVFVVVLITIVVLDLMNVTP